MRIHYIQHEPFEAPGNIINWAKERAFSLSSTKLYENEDFPEIESFDFLVIMGGSMNIYEESKYSWLKNEKKFIEKAIKADKTILGICLGSQLIADVLGAKVYKNKYKEIGWFPVNFASEAMKPNAFNKLPESFNVLHWHGDTFDIPDGSIPIASSEACKNQGFIYNNKVIGLQFHPEMTVDSFEELARNCMDEIKSEKYVQPLDYILSQSESFNELEKFLYKFLDNLY